MTKHTTRDKIWSEALKLAAEVEDSDSYRRRFGWEDVAKRLDDPPSDRTIRDTLSTMEELGHLSRGWGKGQYEPLARR
jgi:hypothetical protein